MGSIRKQLCHRLWRRGLLWPRENEVATTVPGYGCAFFSVGEWEGGELYLAHTGNTDFPSTGQRPKTKQIQSCSSHSSSPRALFTCSLSHCWFHPQTHKWITATNLSTTKDKRYMYKKDSQSLLLLSSLSFSLCHCLVSNCLSVSLLPFHHRPPLPLASEPCLIATSRTPHLTSPIGLSHTHPYPLNSTYTHSFNMQALTPLLFSMLFPRSGSKNVVERELSRQHENDNASQSLLSHRQRTNELPRFQEGYLLQDRTHNSQEQRQKRSTKARKHRSAPTIIPDSNTARRDVDNSLDMDNRSGITRADTFPPTRRAAPPKRLSLDHAALSTFPMLDGLGDTSRPRDYYHSSPSPSPSYRNTATQTNNSRSSPKPKSLRKKQSQELALSRSSTSSMCSMVSDSSSLSSSPSLGELRTPTPTRSAPSEYRRSIDNTTKDLIVLHGFGEEDGRLCMSPKSSNFIDAEISPLHEGYSKARGQRQLIAH